MRRFRFSTWVMLGLAVALILIPSGQALAAVNASFVYEPLAPVEGETIQFSDTSSGNPVAWRWDMGDSWHKEGPNPTHFYPHPGDYTVKLTVYDQSGNESEFELRIQVVNVGQESPPIAGFTVSIFSPAVNQPVDFINSSTGENLSYQWDFRDGATSSEENPTHSFTEAGDYPVTLTATNTQGSDDREVVVTVFEDAQSPEADFFFRPMNPTVGEVVNFFAHSGGGPGDSWDWDFDDGETSSEQYPGHPFDSEDAYDVSLTVTNSAGESTIEQTVNVGAVPPPIDPDFDNVYFVPSASHAGGAEGSFWLTDVDINNAGDDTATYKFAWLPRKADNSDSAKSEEFTLEPGEAVRVEDPVDTLFATTGHGALAVVSDSRDLFVFSRTYNDGDLGTFGTAVPGVNEKDLIEGDTRKRLLFFTEDGAFRSNIAFQNGTGSNLWVSWERYLADGTLVQSGATELAPFSNKQLNAVYKDDAPIEAAYMDVWTDTDGGKFMVFSSVIDNGTGDGTVVQPQW